MSLVAFESKRLLARRLEPDDRQPMLAVYGDADAMRWVGDGKPLTAEQCDRWLQVTADNYRRRGYGMLALIERATGEVVGFCGLVHPGGQAQAEIKYAFLRSAWGRGLATEAVGAMLGYCASVHGLQEIIATVAPANEASRRVLAKAGLQEGARRRNDDGTDTLVYLWHPSASAGRRVAGRDAGRYANDPPRHRPAMSVDSVSYAEFDAPPEALARAVDEGLDLHNQQTAPLSDVRPLGAFASDPAGRPVGGAVGRTWGACCELLQLWVDPSHRRQGIASRLLRQFEARAAGRGCSVFYLTTLSFQAPAFYRKHGYASLAEIRGYPDEIAKYLMYKESPLESSRDSTRSLLPPMP